MVASAVVISSASLLAASEMGGHTLTDRGTYIARQKNLDLEVLVECDPSLFNVYHVMQINPEKSGQTNADAAVAFVEIITTMAAQDVIRGYGVDRFGRPLFVPDAYVESTPGAQTAA